MRLIINMGLSNKVVQYHVTPIAKAINVDEIYIIRNQPGPTIRKVQYFYPPTIVSRIPIAKEFYKLLLTIIISLQKKPDFLLSFILFPHGFLTLLSSILIRKPTILSLLNGKAEFYSIGTRDRSKKMTGLPKIGYFLIMLVKCFNIITTTGSKTKDFLIEYDISDEKILILPHAMPPKNKFVSNDKIYDCIYVGRLTRIKHIEVMIKALALVKKEIRSVKAVILGDGICRADLEKFVSKIGLDYNIKFLGYVDNVEYYLRKSKCFVFCSEREGLPFAILEALNCNIPVISSDCGDILDILKDNYNSKIISNYYDYYDYYKGIILLLSNKNYYTSLVKNIINDKKVHDIYSVKSFWENVLA